MFDIEQNGLGEQGGAVRVVLPLTEAIPDGALSSLRGADGEWRDFTPDAYNSLYSAPGAPGYCPPPGYARYVPRLHAGDNCVQLLLLDGVPNDGDGQANAHISLLGAIAAPLSMQVSSSSNGGGGAFGLLWLFVAGGLWHELPPF